MARITRREWLGSAIGASVAPTLRGDLAALVHALGPWRGAPAEQMAEDEAFWQEVMAAFDQTPPRVNLVTVVRGTTPRVVRQAIADEGNRLDAFRPRPRAQSDPDWARVRGKAASFVNAPAEQVALLRNTTEGVTTVLNNWPLQRGDEVLTTSTEHFPFYGALAYRAHRDGIVPRQLHLPVPAPSGESIVEAFEAAMTPRTRLVMLPHVVLYGQILPVRQIADRVHARGAKLLVDGVLSVGHLPVDVAALDCDFFAAGFHKWGCGPRATAVFFVKPDLVQQLPPLFGSVRQTDAEGTVPQWNGPRMAKYEAYGAHPESHFYALETALDFLTAIGLDRIQRRLFTLTKRWTDRATRLGGFRIAVQVDPGHCAGLVGWEWAGRTADSVAAVMREASVYSGGTERYGGIFGIPESAPRWLFCTNTAVFTSLEDVDRLAATLETIATM